MSRPLPLIAQTLPLLVLLTLLLKPHLNLATFHPDCPSDTPQIPISTMPSAVKPPQTLYDKVFEDHIVEEKADGTVLLYIGMFLAVTLLSILTDSVQTGILSMK